VPGRFCVPSTPLRPFGQSPVTLVTALSRQNGERSAPGQCSLHDPGASSIPGRGLLRAPWPGGPPAVPHGCHGW